MWNFVKGLAAALVMTTPAFAEWSPREIDRHITETNFVVGEHCTATLISAEHRLLLTNNHCVDMFVKERTEKVVNEEGVVSQIKKQDKSNVPVSQKNYEGITFVGINTYVSKIVDVDRKNDIALLQILTENIPNEDEAEIFTGDHIYRGETVYAVGNSLVIFDGTVTKGIISSVNRNLDAFGVKGEFYYQMDAGIVGGNSGGALYNDDGKLIGIPSAGIRGSHLSFAVPYSSIQNFLTENCYAELFDNEAETYEQCKGIDEE